MYNLIIYLVAFTLANEPDALAFMQDTKYVPAAFKNVLGLISYDAINIENFH